MSRVALGRSIGGRHRRGGVMPTNSNRPMRWFRRAAGN